MSAHIDTARAILAALEKAGHLRRDIFDDGTKDEPLVALVVGVLEAQEPRTAPAWHGRTMPPIGKDDPFPTVEEYMSAETPADYFQRLGEALPGIPVVTVDGLDGAHLVRTEDVAKALHDLVNAPLVHGGGFAPDISGGREEGDGWVQFYGKGGGPSVLMSTKLEAFLRSQPMPEKPDTTVADYFLRGQTTPVGVTLAAEKPAYAPEWLARMVEVAPDVHVPRGANGQPSEAVQRERQRPGESEADWLRRVWGFTEPLLYEQEGDITRYVGTDGRVLLAWPTGMWRWLTALAADDGEGT